MKRVAYINLVGVCALASLCVAQWQHDRRLNLQINGLEKTRLEQAGKLTEQERSLRGVNADLAQFKEQFSKAQSELSASLQNLRAAERLTNQFTLERQQLKSSVTNWANAVAARDQRLKEANAEISRLANELNASIRKYNELASNYNGVVKDLNELRARLAQLYSTNAAQTAPALQPGRHP